MLNESDIMLRTVKSEAVGVQQGFSQCYVELLTAFGDSDQQSQ